MLLRVRLSFDAAVVLVLSAGVGFQVGVLLSAAEPLRTEEVVVMALPWQY